MNAGKCSRCGKPACGNGAVVAGRLVHSCASCMPELLKLAAQRRAA